MACQLVEMGHEVNFSAFRHLQPHRSPQGLFDRRNVCVFWRQHAGLSLLSGLSLLRQRIREGTATHHRVREEILAARSSGRPKPTAISAASRCGRRTGGRCRSINPPISGRITLFKARSASDKVELPEDYGWSTVAGKGLEIISVPGSHLVLFEPENVESLAISLHLALSRSGYPSDRIQMTAGIVTVH